MTPETGARSPMSVDWIDLVNTDPDRALEMLVLGWYGAEDAKADPDAPTEDQLADLPRSLAAFHRLARHRPALYRFSNPIVPRPWQVSRPHGELLVFAVENQHVRDWSIRWPSTDTDPRVWLTEDPWFDPNPETILEAEPLSRFLLQFTLHAATGLAPFNAWSRVMPVERLDPLRDFLRPVPLSPWLPTYTADLFYAAPGLLASVCASEGEAMVAFAARDRETLAPLRKYDFPWTRFDE
ncbi:hypothetical protein [Actinoplanes solisilvae]|uniref:hypothetical protein n=1 Tax=Actinoplanes solisilvae TaxID=2486853 RepID=UPI000FD6F253|nr:hypothetical protein [Actinoplanes solisilvae]